LNYDRIGIAIGAYEASKEVNQFSSKFDYYLDGLVDLTPKEKMGMELFNGDAKCSGCHVSNVDPVTNMKPLFTDFTFDNLGVPKNHENPFYRMNKVYLPDGSPINPLGTAWIDPGLGGFLANQPNLEWRTLADKNMGKFKVPTLRNVDKRPGNGFIKAYMHNGVFKSLKEVVHFYNTRDIASWPPPEVAKNVNTSQLGNLGLTRYEEDAIVDFLQTLSDDYKIPKPGHNKLPGSTASLDIGGPNPFNPSTKLNYYLPEDAVIRIEVFNITGQKVATLQDGLMNAGEHQVTFSANNLSSGIYIVSLQTGQQLLTQKLILMK
jgi:hypothetical protein